jgi:phenylacetate-coenzyme A ligase PaaK-like adenylate-forming protein
MRQLRAREAWPRGQIAEYQLAKLNRLWKHAVCHVPYYRDLGREHGLPEQFRSLAEFRESMPLLPKAEVRRRPRHFLSERARPGCWRRTSGSTGTPMSLYADAASHREMLHAKYGLYDAWGIDILDQTVYVWANPEFMTGGWRGAPLRAQLAVIDTIRGRRRLSAYHLDRTSLARCLDQIERFRPQALYGFSNAIFMLAQQARQRGFSSPGLKAVIMTSEPATPRMRAVVEESFGTPAVIEYGATECQLIAGQYPDDTLRVREDLALLEALPRPPHGYELVLTVLTNPSFPLLRYQIADLTDGPLEYPEQGLAVLRGGIVGRRDDLLQTAGGGRLHASAIDAVFEHRFTGSAIGRFRAHQDRSGALDVQIEVDQRTTLDFNLDDLRDTIGKLLEGYPVYIRLTDRLEAAATTKHRAVTSELTSRGLLVETGFAAS